MRETFAFIGDKCKRIEKSHGKLLLQWQNEYASCNCNDVRLSKQLTTDIFIYITLKSTKIVYRKYNVKSKSKTINKKKKTNIFFIYILSISNRKSTPIARKTIPQRDQ